MNKLFGKLLFLIWVTLLTVSSSAQGLPNDSNKVEKKLKSVDVHYVTLGGLQYSVDGTALTSYKDFEELIDPLRDFEATRLLKKSETSDFEGKLFGVIGIGGLVTGLVGILATSSNEQAPFWITGIGGAALFNIGTLFQSEAQTTKFNCVQRYNRFARGEEQVLPQGPQDEKSLLDFQNPGKNSK